MSKDKNNNAIVNAIRNLSPAAKTALSEKDHFNYHPELHEVLGLILYNDDLGPIDWSAVSDDLSSDNWQEAGSLAGKSTNDLRAMMYQHLRNERFNRGHIQQLAASGYLDKWADALAAS